MTAALTLTATFRVKPGTQAEAAAWMTSLLEPVRAEDGCIAYDLYIAADDPESFMFFEIWRDQAAVEAHMKAAPFLEFAARSPEFIEGAPALSFYTKN